MDNLPKLREICDFLGREPEQQLYHYGALQNSFYKQKLDALYAALDQYDNATGSADNNTNDCLDLRGVDELIDKNKGYKPIVGSFLKIGDSLLYDLTRIAFGSSRGAGYACYKLGCIYDQRESPYRGSDVEQSYLRAAYFYGQALEKSYVCFKSKKAYAEACAHLGWFDTALHWFPEDAQEYELVRTYLEHRIWFCKKHGVTFPKTKNGIVCFEETKNAAELKEAFFGILDSQKKLRRNMDALERKIPQNVVGITRLLDSEETDILGKKKRARRMWWLLFLVITICAAPGWLLGNGDGIQGISYKLFMTVYAPFGNDFTEGMSLVERLSSSLDASARGTIAGTGMAVHAILTLLWTTFLKFFKRKRYAAMYASAKRKLYDTYKIEELLGQNEDLEQIDLLDVKNINGYKFKTPNHFAEHLHFWLAIKARRSYLPSVYGEDVKHMEYTAGNELLHDYDAFVNAMRMFQEKDSYALLWSGEDLAHIYYSIDDCNEKMFADYFVAMFESAASLSRSREQGDSYFNSQISVLKNAVYRKEWERTHPASDYGDSSSYASSSTVGSDSGDNSDRWSNFLTYGAFGTDEEILDALHREGKISDSDAAKAKTYGWKVRDLDDDGT